ncbi:MAG: ATP-dependent DNA helicase RecQ [Fimbriimonadaceae bacterium]|nr:ATP-dependent DNA helicase RecQ [Fimbriimonadaceae bacterium]
MAESRARLEMSEAQLQAALRDAFGYAAFRPGQAEVVQRQLAGEDQLVVRPTGSGKSLCYQLPGLLLPPLSVVVSPLVALMKDQVDALCARQPEAATCINSSLPADEQRARLRAALEGRVRLLYVAPERFRLQGFRSRLQEAQIQRFVVDEAHCVSEWGHDFRPDYLYLREVLPALGDPPLLALTATATIAVQDDLLSQLGRPQARREVSGFNRSNLSFEIVHAVDTAMKWRQLERLVTSLEGSGIIYAATRRETEEVADFLSQRTHRPVACYHAGFDGDVRNAAQDQFMNEPDALVVATIAFGMGIDKPDVRFVIHFSLPGTVEAYYQQAGRAGRDGLPARCIMIHDPADRGLQEWFIDQDQLTTEQLETVLAALREGLGELPELAARLGGNEIQARVAISTLERLGLLVDHGPGERDRYAVRPGGLTASVAAEHERRTAARRRMRFGQLDAICHYAELADPRRTYLLRYFGDRTEPAAADLAHDDPALPAPDPGVVTPEEVTVGRTVLEAAAAVQGGLGRQRLVQLLRGSAAAGVTDRMRRLTAYGQLRALRNDQVLAALDDLVLGGYLKAVNGKLPVLVPTKAGRAVLADPQALLELPAVRRSAPVLAAVAREVPRAGQVVQGTGRTAADEERFERLRAWRADVARQKGIAPFLVLTNKVLELLAQVVPQDHRTLLGIPGLGPNKVEWYGADLLRVLTPDEVIEVPATNGSAAPPPAGLDQCWTLPRAGGAVEGVFSELQATLDPARLALAAAVDHHADTAVLLSRLSRAHAVPVNLGLCTAHGDLRRVELLAWPLLLVGGRLALERAAEAARHHAAGPLCGWLLEP